MVWHSYMLNPRVYLEDCLREGRMRLWHTAFPSYVVAEHIDPSTHHYDVEKHAMTSFEEQTGLGWDNLDGQDDANVDCHVCGTRNTAPWTTYGEVSRASLSNSATVLEDVQTLLSTCHGFADKGFTLTCQECRAPITHDSLCVGKLRKDLVKLIEQDVVLPGNLLDTNGIPARVGKVSGTGGWSFAVFPSKLLKIDRAERILHLQGSDMRMASVRKAIEEYLAMDDLVNEAKHYKSNVKPYPDEALAVRRMMSRYWENASVFAIDLVGAVIRQGSFVEKMHDINWLASPALSNTMYVRRRVQIVALRRSPVFFVNNMLIVHLILGHALYANTRASSPSSPNTERWPCPHWTSI
jgi:hypothetical protein